MTQQRLQRFDFNSLRDFRGPIVIKTVAKEEARFVEPPPPPPPPPTFSQAELDAAQVAGRKAGYLEGFNAGAAEAKAQAEQKLEEAKAVMLQLAASLSSLERRYGGMLESESKNLAQLVTSIARKVAGDALDRNGEQAIYELVERCLPVVLSKPRLNIELNPTVMEHTIDRIETYLASNGFEGEIHFKANEALGQSDVSLDWGSGQVYRSADELWNEIEGLISRVPLEIAFDDTLDPHALTQEEQQPTTGE